MSAAVALPLGWETGPLAEELRTYLAQRNTLLEQFPGKFALVKGSKIVGLYDRKEEAYNEGYEQFHRAAFLVKQVQEQDKTFYVGGSVLGIEDEEVVAATVQAKREDILRIAESHGASNVRVFGSMARGEAGPDSDVDFLVDAGPKHSAWFPAGLTADLEELLGRRVDVATPDALHWFIRDRVLQEARPL